MKTIVSYITGRKDFPVFIDMPDEEIISHLQEGDWADVEVNVSEEGDIEVKGSDYNDTFRIIDVESVNPKPKNKTYRVRAIASTTCYLDVEAESASEAQNIAENTDGGDFISEDDGGDWIILDANQIN